MSARGASISGRGAEWSDGQRDVDKGQQQLRKSADRAADGEQDLRKARDAVAKAEQRIQQAQADQLAAQQRIAAGTAQMSRAETEYTTIRQQPSVVQPQR
jgi:chromosome segregation ATPase